MSLLVIGRTSLLARHYANWRAGQTLPSVTAVSHDTVTGPADLEDYGCVIVFALDPRFKTDPYTPDIDIETRIAGWAAEAGTHLVMLSTRMVYGPAAQWGAREDAVLAPETPYGRNKAEAEARVAGRLGDRATILRLANITAFEYPEPGRRTFMAMVLRRLKEEGAVRYDMDPCLERDFLPFPAFASLLTAVADARPGGIWNAGAGFAVPTGDIARWVIEGFGAGDLMVEDKGARDAFYLDMTKSSALGLAPVTAADVRGYCRDLGRRLRRT